MVIESISMELWKTLLPSLNSWEVLCLQDWVSTGLVLGQCQWARIGPELLSSTWGVSPFQCITGCESGLLTQSERNRGEISSLGSATTMPQVHNQCQILTLGIYVRAWTPTGQLGRTHPLISRPIAQAATFLTRSHKLSRGFLSPAPYRFYGRLGIA